MILAPYEPRHLEAAVRLWRDSWLSTAVGSTQTLDPDELLARLPVEIEGGWRVFLGWEGETLVGFLALDPAHACLAQLFVLPAAQGRGLGALLLDLAKSEMARGFWLTAATGNPTALRFYEKHGLRAGETRVHRQGHPIVVYRWPERQ